LDEPLEKEKGNKGGTIRDRRQRQRNERKDSENIKKNRTMAVAKIQETLGTSWRAWGREYLAQKKMRMGEDFVRGKRKGGGANLTKTANKDSEPNRKNTQ